MKYLLHGFRNYLTLSGRDTRTQFWNFITITHLIAILLLIPALGASVQLLQELLENEEVVQMILAAIDGNDFSLLYQNEELYQTIRSVALDYWHQLWQENILVCATLILAILWDIALILPTLCAITRRLRDAGHNPYWTLAVPTAFILPAEMGFILSTVTFILCCLPSAAQPAQGNTATATS